MKGLLSSSFPFCGWDTEVQRSLSLCSSPLSHQREEPGIEPNRRSIRSWALSRCVTTFAWKRGRGWIPPPPTSLRYNWHGTLCKFKLYNMLIWYTYTLQNDYHHSKSFATRWTQLFNSNLEGVDNFSNNSDFRNLLVAPPILFNQSAILVSERFRNLPKDLMLANSKARILLSLLILSLFKVKYYIEHTVYY